MADRSPISAWCRALGAAGIVLAARLHEIHLHTGDVAINDQWQIEAADVIAPWLDGNLQSAAFFKAHFEHVPACTRLLAWLEVALTGRWDPFVQTTVNALIYSGFIALVARWLAAHLRPTAALAVTALLVLLGALSHDWENITWGFQSQFPCALVFLFWHVQGSLAHAPGSRGWWWAQAAALGGLFTLASMWLAPLAVVLALFWTKPRGSRLRLVPVGLVLLGLVIIALIRARAPVEQPFAQTAGSVLQFLYTLLDLLGWPAGWPGALVWLNLPLLFFALQLRGRQAAAPFDCTVLALGLWGAAQAAALAFARSADYGGYVSRYGELLAVLVLANAVALVRLAPATGRWRPAAAFFALGWAGTVVAGTWQLSIGGHAQYFHEHAAANIKLRRDAVQAYLFRHDRSLLAQPGTRWVLYQGVDTVTGLLDRPRFRALLPHSVDPANPPDFAGSAVRALQARTPWVAVAAGGLLLTGATLAMRNRRELPALPAFIFQPEPLLPWLAAPTAVAAGALVFCWSDPFTFDLAERWRRFFNPPGGVGPLRLHLEQSSAAIPDEYLVAAAPLSPLAVRLQFSGTNPGSAAFTCTALSQPFPVESPWLVVPVAGWPVAPGNGLRLRIEEPWGEYIAEVDCPGPGSAEIGFWAADVRPYRGKQARLVLYDGRTDTEAWLAAAPPIATDDPALAGRLAAALDRERMAPAHAALGSLSAASICLLTGWFLTRRHAGSAGAGATARGCIFPSNLSGV